MTDTPSLSKLVAELRLGAFSRPKTTALMNHAADAIERLSRLSGNGGGLGGAATPSASLEEELSAHDELRERVWDVMKQDTPDELARIRRGEIWNDHIAVQAALAAIRITKAG